jgi:hypothetical protein
MEWIDLAEYRNQLRALVNAVMSRRVPYNVRELLNRFTTVSF